MRQTLLSTAMRRLYRFSLFALAAAVLAWIFAAYLHPEFMRNVSEQIWACF